MYMYMYTKWCTPATNWFTNQRKCGYSFHHPNQATYKQISRHRRRTSLYMNVYT